ncbi:hypothetical protein D9613_008899 [Agrocybe pediades]|uniref:F-box domain-containing protein n=1 Tax=Agrocybe pediades TaxID=84607 RepID=A0A8H4QSY7_9AGAR|nr:hypothetical protein D9613_008899 [Agrocybe pediades]
MPFETWSTIFQHLIQGTNTTRSRLRLLHVNREWRGIATGTPRLWTDLHIRRPDPSQAQFFLKNSGALPVNVNIELLNLSSTPKPKLAALTKTLSEHIHRIRTLDIHVEEHTYADSLIAQIGAGQDAPLLESLSVRVEKESGDLFPSFEALQSAFRSTPKITHLSLPAYPLPNSSSPLLSTGSITHLTLDATPFYSNLNHDMLFDMLGSVSGNLESFTFKGSDDFSYATGFPEFNMPHLTSADVAAPGWGLDILSAFRAPALSDVRLDALMQKEYHTPEDWASLFGEPVTRSLRLLSERSPSIKRLDLAGTPLREPKMDYTWLFGGAFPMLETLRFEGTDITDELLATATASGMPNLKELEISNCAGVQGHGLISFLRIRREGFKLILKDNSSISKDMLENISSLAAVVTL